MRHTQQSDDVKEVDGGKALQDHVDLLTAVEEEFVPLPWHHDHHEYMQQHPREDLGPPVAMEVCSGSAGLTTTLKQTKTGVKAFGIDDKRNVHKPSWAYAHVGP